MIQDVFHALTAEWFEERFGAPTEPQRLGWPAIASGQHTLIAAPTGSGKTLAAFLVCIDRLLRQALDGPLARGVQVVYVSPLKALSNDIERNLRAPLAEIDERAVEAGFGKLGIRTAVRTGDTPAAQRQQMLRQPPHILVTTPESLYLLLTSAKARDLLRGTHTVIVDEIHALARDKRGSHLSLTLERLARLCDRPPTRIGLSATQRPMDQIARFLVGQASDSTDVNKSCHIVDVGHARQLDIAVDVPPGELAAVCSGEQWGEVYQRLTQLIQSHRSTLVFVNTRRFAERVAHRLREILGEEAVASHHGSLSRDLRLAAEQRLKDGQLKAIVATASLEMGLDIGYIDLVCQIGSPRSIATFLQRVGRAGHSLRAIPKGRLFPLTRDELLESLALIRAVKLGRLDTIEIPQAPLDILAQQIVAAVSCEEWSEDELYGLCRRAWPYRDLTRADFDAVIGLLAEGLTPALRRGAHLHRDQIHGRLRARAGARLAALTSGGAIPEAPLYRVVTEDDSTFVGTVDEHFAIDSSAGDVFVLGNTSWQIRAIRGSDVIVRDAQGAPPTIPFWFGEAPGRTVELSAELSELRRELAMRLQNATPAQNTTPVADSVDAEEFRASLARDPRSPEAQAAQWLRAEAEADDWAAAQAVRYVAAQVAAIGTVPTTDQIVFERFFDESGGMQLVIHAPLGHRINRAWGMALRKRFCRSFDFELQAAATDNGILLSVGPQHSFPIEQLFKMLGPHNGRQLLEQALLAQPMFPLRWRWNISRALAVLRFHQGRKVPFHIQRFRADDLLAAAFPETVGCLENHHGDIQIPDHPLVRQTIDDCLHEAMDLNRWLGVLADYQAGRVRFTACDTREPSPFSHELLNANPYAFLDPADLEERRTRAVSVRRSLAPEEFRDLTRLDPGALAQVTAEAWPIVRNADELHDALSQLVVLNESEGAGWERRFEELVVAGRAARVRIEPQPTADHAERTAAVATPEADAPTTDVSEADAVPATPARVFWIATERWPIVRAVYAGAVLEVPLAVPASLDKTWQRSDGWVEVLRGRMPFAGPRTASELADCLALDVGFVRSALEALEGQGVVLRGRFRGNDASSEVEWCDRRLLARIQRLTLDGLRRRIQPATPVDFVRFLMRHQRLGGGYPSGPHGVREALAQLQGYELPGGAWERFVLSQRIAQFDSQWVDQLFLAGEATWGRLRPPRRDDADGPGFAALTRSMPLSLVLREDLPWLLPPDRAAWPASGMREPAQQVLEALDKRGALFVSELRLLTRLDNETIAESLRELAAVGLVSSDTFASVRALARRARPTSAPPLDRAWSASSEALVAGGRWSQFPGPLFTALAAERAALGSDDPRSAGTTHVGTMSRVERWCWQLLRRYGVVFRDLVVRESAAPPWHELVPVLRRMELRGEIRGGRFVSGVSGEQFATESAVGQLREARDLPPDGWVLVSAADPVNLSGVVVPGPRVPATHKNAVILLDGRCVAARRGGQIDVFDESLDAATRDEMIRCLHHLRPPARPTNSAPATSTSVPRTSAPTPSAPSPSPSPLPTSSPPTSPGPPGLDAPRAPQRKVQQIRQRWAQF